MLARKRAAKGRNLGMGGASWAGPPSVPLAVEDAVDTRRHHQFDSVHWILVLADNSKRHRLRQPRNPNPKNPPA